MLLLKICNVYLLEIALYANRKHRNILVVCYCSLDETSINDLLIWSQGAVTVIAYLQCRYELLNESGHPSVIPI